MVERFGTAERSPRQGYLLPFARVAFDEYKKAFPGNPGRVVMRNILTSFSTQELENSKIFRDSQGASLPFTKIDVKALAGAVSGLPVSHPEAPAPKHKRFFVLPAFLLPSSGHQFTFAEVVIKEAIKYLPGVIADLKAGNTPPDIQIFTLGAPTNEKWGEITPDYLSMLKDDAYGTLGSTYANLIAKQLPENPQERAKTSVVIFGQSMSASLAAKAAEKLMERGETTQDIGKRAEGVPYVQVIMDAPVTLIDPSRRKPQLIAGFALESLRSLVSNPHIGKTLINERKFINDIAAHLRAGGIPTFEDPGQITLKKEGLSTVINALYNQRLSVPPGLVVNIRRGTKDLAVNPFGFSKQVQKKLQKRDPSIGMHLVKDPQLDVGNPVGSREAAVEGTHTFSLTYTKHDIQKWGVGIETILKTLENRP